MPERVLPILLLVALLAGCSGGEASAPTTSVPAFAPPATVTEETGSIQGLVLDDESLPVAGATIGLLPEQLRAETDAAGAFTFNNVTPGPHTILASRLGYEDASVRVDVMAGEIAKPRLSVTRLSVDDPHQVTLLGSVFLQVAISDVHRESHLDGITCSPCEYWWHTQPGVDDGLFEVFWVPSVSAPMVNEIFSFAVNVEAKNTSIGGQEVLAQGQVVWRGNMKSGEQHRFSEDEAAKFPEKKETVTMVFVNTPDLNLGINQKIDLFLTLAYDMKLDDAFTALPSK